MAEAAGAAAARTEPASVRAARAPPHGRLRALPAPHCAPPHGRPRAARYLLSRLNAQMVIACSTRPIPASDATASPIAPQSYPVVIRPLSASIT